MEVYGTEHKGIDLRRVQKELCISFGEILMGDVVEKLNQTKSIDKYLGRFNVIMKTAKDAQ